MTERRPGLFDLQVNGFAGVDYNRHGVSGEELERSFVAMRASGVTACLPTVITSSLAHFQACARQLVRCQHPLNVGLHMEGPYISPHDGPRGAHPREHVRPPSIDDFKSRQDAAEGRIKLVTLAPESEGALPLIAYLVEQGITVALGHTGADGKTLREAAAAGATMSTHLGNGCGATVDRHHNVLWPQLADDRLSAGFIADGMHLPADMLRAMIRAKGAERTLLVTDAMAGAGAPPGRYTIGDIEADVDAAGRVSQPPAGNLAGSALTMDRAVVNTVRWTGLDFDTVWRCASVQPARAVGLPPPPELEVEWDPTTQTLHIAPDSG